MPSEDLRSVIFLPGGITPAAIQYAPLLGALGDGILPLLKDLEVYAGDQAEPAYSLDLEVESLRRSAETAGFELFDLVAYSAGGAVALAFMATYPDSVRSLALVEPAVIPSQDWLRQETAFMQAVKQSMELPPGQQVPAFMRANLRSDVPIPPPPAGDPPPWMAKRPAGLKALIQAFEQADYHYEHWRRFLKPVYLAVGELSNPVEERKALLLSGLFQDCQVELYHGIHHFNPPQRAEPERFALALTALWTRAGV